MAAEKEIFEAASRVAKMAISVAEKTEREPAAERVDLWAIDLAAEMAG